MLKIPAVPDQITMETAVIKLVSRKLIFCISLINTSSDLIELADDIHNGSGVWVAK
jgi:hypothetical protein